MAEKSSDHILPQDLSIGGSVNKFCFTHETLQVLTTGLTSLINLQRHFADEFGLAYNRVFQNDFEPFKDRSPQEVLTEWLQDEKNGVQQLSAILQDLIDHQIALISGLDGIASEALSQLHPRQHHKKGAGFMGIRPFAWQHYRSYYDILCNNKNLRHQKMVLPGFINKYAQAREESKATSRGKQKRSVDNHSKIVTSDERTEGKRIKRTIHQDK